MPWNIHRMVHLWLNSHTIFPSCSLEVYHPCPPLYIVYYHCLPTPNSLINWNSRNVCSIHSCWKCMLNEGSPWVICLETYIGWFHLWLNSHTIFPSSSSSSCSFVVYHLCPPLDIVYYRCLPFKKQKTKTKNSKDPREAKSPTDDHNGGPKIGDPGLVCNQ